jgi:G2/mitotic-specific cyclin 3/4
MRSDLIDWLVKVHGRLGLVPETLFLAVNYVDRFLSRKIVPTAKLPLVGATAILIASKYEETHGPSLQEIALIVDSSYTINEILRAERFMLKMLRFELGSPGPISFLRRINKADEYDLQTRTLAKYFLEVSAMDKCFVGSPPSYLAAAAYCLSRLMLKKGDWVGAFSL